MKKAIVILSILIIAITARCQTVITNDTSNYKVNIGSKSLNITPFTNGEINILDGAFFTHIYPDTSKAQTMGIYVNSVGDTIINCSYVDFKKLIARGLDVNFERSELYKVDLSNGYFNTVHATDSTAGFAIKNVNGLQTFEISEDGITKLSIDTTLFIDIPSKGSGKYLKSMDENGTAEWAYNVFKFTPTNKTDNRHPINTITYDHRFLYVKINDNPHLWIRFVKSYW
jgi:hypothetical protein